MTVCPSVCTETPMWCADATALLPPKTCHSLSLTFLLTSAMGVKTNRPVGDITALLRLTCRRTNKRTGEQRHTVKKNNATRVLLIHRCERERRQAVTFKPRKTGKVSLCNQAVHLRVREECHHRRVRSCPTHRHFYSLHLSDRHEVTLLH